MCRGHHRKHAASEYVNTVVMRDVFVVACDRARRTAVLGPFFAAQPRRDGTDDRPAPLCIIVEPCRTRHYICPHVNEPRAVSPSR